MANILLIDDAPDFCLIFNNYLGRMSHSCATATSLNSGLKKLHDSQYDLVFLDINLGSHNGLAHLTEVMNTPGSPDVVVVSGEGKVEDVEKAINSGAKDFLVKPFTFMDLERCLSRCIRYRQARERFVSKTAFLSETIIGSSPKFLRAIQQVGIVARTRNNVLILGETGTGKELFARAVHDNSSRRDKPFTIVDCTNLPTTLAQSILFGHEKGTFTDAKEKHEGLFKQADGGTIFLDEIADLDQSIQKSLLRVLQERSFRPLNSKKEIRSDFRLIAATNRDLAAMVKEGTFRQDLLFRLTSYQILLPPLRDRVEDIPALAAHYMKRGCQEFGFSIKRFSDDYLQVLQNFYDWPGNVRELINVINYSISHSFDSKTLHPFHLPAELRICHLKSSLGAPAQRPTTTFATSIDDIAKAAEPDEDGDVVESRDEELLPFKEVRKRVVAQMETEYLHKLIARTDGDIKKACKMAGLSRARLYELLQKHEVDYHGND